MKSIEVFKKALLVVLISALAFVVVIRYQARLNQQAAEEAAEASVEPEFPDVTEADTDAIAITSPSPSADVESYNDKPKVDITSWELRLVNANNTIDSSFSTELSDLGKGQSFDSRAFDYLQLLLAAASNEGYKVNISSAYRSYKTQETLFDNKVNEYLSSEGSREAAEKKAKTIVAYPGTSEHQLGLSCDITDKYYEYMDESLADTALLKWLRQHCSEYGFILRYPEDKQNITGVMFEPWHFRYVGIPSATYIMKNNLCLEEFLVLYK